MKSSSSNMVGTDEQATKSPKTQIPSQLGYLGIELDKLEKIINTLNEGLQPVMRMQQPKIDLLNPDEENLVDLANCIRDNVRRVSSMIDDISSMLGLLEL